VPTMEHELVPELVPEVVSTGVPHWGGTRRVAMRVASSCIYRLLGSKRKELHENPWLTMTFFALGSFRRERQGFIYLRDATVTCSV